MDAPFTIFIAGNSGDRQSLVESTSFLIKGLWKNTGGYIDEKGKGRTHRHVKRMQFPELIHWL